MWKSRTLKYSLIGVIAVGVLVFLSTSVDIFVTSDISKKSESITPLLRCSIEYLLNVTDLGIKMQNAEFLIVDFFENRASFVADWERSLIWSSGASVQVQNGQLFFSGTGEYGIFHKQIISDISFTYKVEGVVGDNSGVLIYPTDPNVPYFIRILSAAKYNCRIELNNKTTGEGSVIFSRGEPPRIRAYTIRIIGPVLIAIWHFWG